jgi:hypothetical protein
MEYTPTPPQVQAPKPEYVLVDDVTGKPPPVRGPQVLVDSKGRKFKVPFAPVKGCKKCYGRGYIGFEAKSGDLIICKKCYPML